MTNTPTPKYTAEQVAGLVDELITAAMHYGGAVYDETYRTSKWEVASKREAMQEARADVLSALSTAESKLTEIAQIIEAVDNRAMAADGPVTPTLQEMTQAEMSCIYALAAMTKERE